MGVHDRLNRLMFFVSVAIIAICIGLFAGVVYLGLAVSKAWSAEPRWDGPFRVQLERVIDADTLEVTVTDPCPFGCVDGKIALRLAYIDTPETRLCRNGNVRSNCAVCAAEAAVAAEALQAVNRLLNRRSLRVRRLEPGKYFGRVIGDVEFLQSGAWVSLSSTLRRKGFAVAYDGGTKDRPWCGLIDDAQ